ncbi:P-loop containing nucleoside triphosphate hydrolase protein [Scenedesmus sp. NREL 46B-D3]|nr:P-loop containing nucleoside triphosphate hydrolase protein [Scenedesmus sp. NREL 46B-D3]
MHTTAGKQARVLICVLCGLPGSGKTSLCKELAGFAVQNGVAVHNLCLDELLKHCKTSRVQGHLPPGRSSSSSSCLQAAFTAAAATGQRHAAVQQHDELPFTAKAWQASRQRLLQESQLVLQQQREQQQQQQHVLLLVDDINHYSSMRYDFVQLARTYGAAFLQIYMDCPMELSLQRNSQRQGADVVPAAVVVQLAAAFEAPQPAKHQWEAGATLTVHCSSSQVTQLQGCQPLPAADCGVRDARAGAGAEYAGSLAEAVWRELLAAWGAPLQPPPSTAELAARRAAGSTANAASALHALDLGSRSLLHDTLAACARDKRAGAAAALNAHRKQLLEQLRQQQQQAGSNVVGTATAPAAGGSVQELLSAFQQLCAEYA